MQAIVAFALTKRTVTYFATALLFIGGIASYFTLGQLEDPEFTIKSAVISTAYPGASPQEVELEVTDRIELAIQEMPQIDYIESLSRAGLSIIQVNIRPSFVSEEMPQIWDELRRKIRDVEGSLPPGAGRPDVADDFGDVFGFQLAVTGDGFSYSELERYAKDLKRELSLVKGVARVDLWGAQQKVIYLDVAETQLTQLGISDQSIESTLQIQNMVVDAGSVDLLDRRLRIAPTGAFETPEDIGNLTIQPSLTDSLQILREEDAPSVSGELIRIRDIGTVIQGYADPPNTMMRYNGLPAIGVSITNTKGVNIVELGTAIDARLAELTSALPVGIETHRVHWQSDIVDEAVMNFLISFLEAVAIVLVLIALFMGWRMGVIIGTSLVVTILASFMLMALFEIDLQRMSLGALVIALGMMVDNSIVVADGISVRLQKGMSRMQAAIEAAAQPSMPLLGATVIAVMAFFPIFASEEDAGEYCATLFSVVAISLLTSWIISMTLTPLQCIDMLPDPKQGEGAADPYGGRFFAIFRGLLERCIRGRWLTIASMVGLLVLAGFSFQRVEQLFFPESSMTKFMIDYWGPEGSRIEQTAAAMRQAEEKIMADERVTGVASYIGAGPPRFYLPVEPEKPYASYAQLVVNVKDYRDIPDIIREWTPLFAENFPDAVVPLRQFGVGPAFTWKFDVRVIGPGDARPETLRAIATDLRGLVEADPLTAYTRTDWRQQVLKVVPEYSQERGRWAGVTREDIARATKRAFDGRQIALYREDDDLIPIVLRNIEDERRNVGGLDVIDVQPALSTDPVPLSQVTQVIDTQWEEPLIWRRDRRRTIKVQGNPVLGETLPTMQQSIAGDLQGYQPPAGYSWEWGGEHESSRDAQASLIPGIIPAAVVMLFIMVALFNDFRPPLVIVLTIPLAFIGITFGLLATGAAFGFLALLGAMSLAGMMIKNAIVLLDEINIQMAEGLSRYDATIMAAVSRLRPVALAAATTVLGVVPLIQDPFFIGLAVTIMAGLAFGTVLTMLVVPTLYATIYGLASPKPVPAAAPA